MMKFENADKLTELKSSFGQWVAITIAALLVSVGMVFLLSMVGFMVYDFIALALPSLIITGVFAAIIYGIYRAVHYHDFRRPHHP